MTPSILPYGICYSTVLQFSRGEFQKRAGMTRPLSYSSVSLPSWTVTTFQTIVVQVRGRLGFTPLWSASGTSGEKSDINEILNIKIYWCKHHNYSSCTGKYTEFVTKSVKNFKIYHQAYSLTEEYCTQTAIRSLF